MKKTIIGLLMLCIALPGVSQERFTVEEAVNYGLKNHVDVKNAIVKRQDTEMDIQETKQGGLPQVNGQFAYTYNAIVPTQLIDAQNFNPEAAPGETVKFKFGVPWGGQAGLSVNQLIYDASFFIGLRAADTYRQLADQTIVQTEITVAENITKAYYSVLVAEERSKILSLNINRIDSLLRTTEALYEQGFAEQLDVDRLNVQKNNLNAELSNVRNLINLSYKLLKFQMGMDVRSSVILTNTLEELETAAKATATFSEISPEDRIEYQLLQTNRTLLGLNMERYSKSNLPSVMFSGTLGAGHSNTRFNPFERWFGSSALTLSAQIPIYDSGLRKTRVERQRLNILQLDNQAEMLKNTFELQNDQAITNLTNGMETLEIQKRNVTLAENVLRVGKIKYQQGVGSNIEVINAENDLRQAQTNYFAALYDVLVAKVDYDKAQGNLLKD